MLETGNEKQKGYRNEAGYVWSSSRLHHQTTSMAVFTPCHGVCQPYGDPLPRISESSSAQYRSRYPPKPWELHIIHGNHVVTNARQIEERRRCTHETRTFADEEWVLTATYTACHTRGVLQDDGEDASAHESTQLIGSCRNGVILPADRRREAHGRFQTNAVAWPSVTPGEEDTVVDDEASDVS